LAGPPRSLNMVLLEFAMNPPDRGDGLSAYVARILDVIDRSGVTYRLTPMGTILEGNFDEVMQVVGDCFRALEPDCERIGMNLKMDYRAGTASRLQSKVVAVQRHLGRTLQT
jgi:uncharacterized protein (TIGR00106 family)